MNVSGVGRLPLSKARPHRVNVAKLLGWISRQLLGTMSSYEPGREPGTVITTHAIVYREDDINAMIKGIEV